MGAPRGVPGLTDSPEHLTSLSEYIATLPRVEKVELLPYHTLGVHKYQTLGIPYPLEGVPPMDKTKLETWNRSSTTPAAGTPTTKKGMGAMSIDVNCTAWKGFRTGEWRHLVNVRNFIQKNYTPIREGTTSSAPISPKPPRCGRRRRP